MEFHFLFLGAVVVTEDRTLAKHMTDAFEAQGYQVEVVHADEESATIRVEYVTQGTVGDA